MFNLRLVWSVGIAIVAFLSGAVLWSCSSGTAPETARDLSGQWSGVATGETDSVNIYFSLAVNEDGSATADLFFPTIPEIDEATGWGRVEGSSLSLVLTDVNGKGVYLTAKADELGAEINGEIAVSDDSNILTFQVFKQ
jgi:hypothetical protein